MHVLVDNSWTYVVCENCRKNLGQDVKMLKAFCCNTEVWVCPNCGATKKL